MHLVTHLVEGRRTESADEQAVHLGEHKMGQQQGRWGGEGGWSKPNHLWACGKTVKYAKSETGVGGRIDKSVVGLTAERERGVGGKGAGGASGSMINGRDRKICSSLPPTKIRCIRRPPTTGPSPLLPSQAHMKPPFSPHPLALRMHLKALPGLQRPQARGCVRIERRVGQFSV